MVSFLWPENPMTMASACKFLRSKTWIRLSCAIGGSESLTHQRFQCFVNIFGSVGKHMFGTPSHRHCQQYPAVVITLSKGGCEQSMFTWVPVLLWLWAIGLGWGHDSPLRYVVDSTSPNTTSARNSIYRKSLRKQTNDPDRLGNTPAHK